MNKTKRNKERYLNIINNKNKCCANCSQLEKDKSGNYICQFSKSWDETSGACVLIQTNKIFQQGKICFDKYNGKNIKNGLRYFNGRIAKLQNIITNK